MKVLGHLALFVLLTVLTQLGGVAWVLSRLWARPLIAFPALYAALALSAAWLAPLAGRVPISCWNDGPLIVQSWIYCVTNRAYVSPRLKQTLVDLSDDLDKAFPDAKTVVLDAGFPFLDGFPMLPHLSHDDGEKVDIALFYQRDGRYTPGATRSPVGYFAFEPGSTSCPDAWPTMRWDLAALQPFWEDLALEPERLRFALAWLADDERIGKIFLEPHLERALGLNEPKIRFQGCRAARHDDHIHIQL